MSSRAGWIPNFSPEHLSKDSQWLDTKFNLSESDSNCIQLKLSNTEVSRYLLQAHFTDCYTMQATRPITEPMPCHARA